MKLVFFLQLFEHKSYTYTYLLACMKTKEAALIDPVIEMVPRDLKLLNQLGLKLKYACELIILYTYVTWYTVINGYRCSSLCNLNACVVLHVKVINCFIELMGYDGFVV